MLSIPHGIWRYQSEEGKQGELASLNQLANKVEKIACLLQFPLLWLYAA